MKASRPAPPTVAINWLMATLVLIALPHFLHLPAWLSIIFLAVMGWRLMNSLRGWPLPEHHLLLRAVHLLLAIIAVVLVISQYGMTIARDAGVALLTVLLAFKLLETRDIRDYYLSCFLGFFLIATQFFFQQSMLIVLLMMVNVLLLTSCMISVNDASSSIRQRLKTSGVLLLQATPMMLLLFVLFPRVPGPLWGVANDYVEVADSMPSRMTLGGLPSLSQGQTGISEAMQVGRISDLVQSDAIAFRVRFADNTIPPNQILYWRGPVLWHTDGEQWQPLATDTQPSQPEISFDEQHRIDYTVTLERHNQQWLFALDLPDSLPQGINAAMNSEGSLISSEVIRKRSQFNLSSVPDYQFNARHEPLLNYALELPDDQHPQARQLAQQLRTQYPEKTDYVQAVLNYFAEQPFYYTLSPPLLSGDVIDSFLFESRHGFCEHYAASFTVLMRAAGIPARVVIGYQGGDVNSVDQILTVRQRDAHAWTEIWLDEQGWIRVDPTSAVASERILSGIRGLLPSERRMPRAFADSPELENLWQQLREHWEAVNNAWELWVVGYDPTRQLELLRKLGMKQPDWRSMAQWLTIGMLLIFIALAWLTLRHKTQRDSVAEAYLDFCRRLSKSGVSINPAEGPMTLAQKAAQQLPEAAADIQAITSDYLAVRYQQQPDKAARFIEKVRHFKPRSHAR